MGGGVRGRRLERRHVRGSHPAARRPRQRPRRAVAEELRQGRSPRRRVRRGNGRDRCDNRRRPPGRSNRDPPPARQARRGLRPRLRLEDEAARPAFSPAAFEALQRRRRQGFRRPPARHELRAQGVPCGGRRGHAPLRGAAPIHPGARALPRVSHRGTARQPSATRARPLELRRRALRARVPRSPHGDVHGPVPPPAAPPVRGPRPRLQPASAASSSRT